MPDSDPMLADMAAGAHDGGRDGDPERRFNAEQNAAVAAGAERYDAFCFFDDTTALQPLHLEPAEPPVAART